MLGVNPYAGGVMGGQPRVPGFAPISAAAFAATQASAARVIDTSTASGKKQNADLVASQATASADEKRWIGIIKTRGDVVAGPTPLAAMIAATATPPVSTPAFSSLAGGSASFSGGGGGGGVTPQGGTPASAGLSAWVKAHKAVAVVVASSVAAVAFWYWR